MMSDKVVIGVFDTYEQAGAVLESLRESDFRPEQISMMGADKEDLRFATADYQKPGPDPAITTGSVLGAVGGWLVGLAAISVPGIGPFLAAGPIFAAISGAAAGGLAGAIAGAMLHFDIPEYEAKIYEGHLTQGKVMVAVHTQGRGEHHRAEAIMEQHGAIEVDTRQEAAANLPGPTIVESNKLL
jgi:hypothetical protein